MENYTQQKFKKKTFVYFSQAIFKIRIGILKLLTVK